MPPAYRPLTLPDALSPDDKAEPPQTPLAERLASIPVRPHGVRDSVLVKPVTPYPHKKSMREDLQRNHRVLVQQSRIERSRRRRFPADWRLILQHLVEATPTYTKPSRGVKVSVPKHSAELLFSDHANNVWNIKSRTGCNMKLYSPHYADAKSPAPHGPRQHPDPYLIISGQPDAINAALEDIQEVAREVTVSKVYANTETLFHDEQVDPVASTLLPVHYPVQSRPYLITCRADQLPRPSEWTIETFQQYVSALTMSRMSDTHAQALYTEGRHKDTVVEQLLGVFEDPVASQAASSPAFKSALTYLVRSGESLVAPAQRLFERAAGLGLRMDVDVFNLMAQTSVKAKNLLAFQSTLRLMIVRGFQPNLRTWILFLRLVEAEEVRRYIIQAMHTKNFFVDPRAVIGVSNEMAANDAYRAIELGQDADAFLAAQRDIYGPEWRVTRHAAHRILYEFGRHGRFDECRQILQVLFASARDKPSAITLNTVLTHCKHLNRLDEAVKFLRLFEARGCHVADMVTFAVLFEAARRVKKPHALSAVWRYAHLVDATNWRMRHSGTLLLSGAKELERLTSRLGGLWAADPPHCKSTPQEFIEMLLFADY
ncbi:hypothetical protein BT67DRAFT_388739, partial [Trichocladium antarcticum]